MSRRGDLFTSFFLVTIFFYGCHDRQDLKCVLNLLPTGRMINDSTREFHSLQKAISASGKFDSCEIQIEAGDYFLSETINLDNLKKNLTITSKSTEKPVIYGGKELKDIVVEGKFWVAEVGDLDFRILEVNDRFAERSRLPAKGTFNHLSTFESKWLSTFQGGFSPKPNAEQLLTMKYNPPDLAEIKDLDNTEITLFHSWDETLLRVASNNTAKHEVTFTQAPAYPAGAFEIRKYVVWNSKYGMTHPGQWYLDRKEGKVYYWPLENENPESSHLVVPVLDEIMHISNSSYIKISNIEFRVNNSPLQIGGFGAKWFNGAINFENSSNLTFENLSFSNLTTHALKGVKCQNVSITGCNIHHIGGIGIRFIGSNSKIANNLIHDVGMVYPSTIALYVNVTDPNAKDEWELGKDEGNVLIDHNEIYNAHYVGICSGGHDTRISNNKVSKVVQQLTDGGGIYVTFCKNLVLKGNFVSDIVNQEGAGTSAYYLDELTNNAIVSENLSINVHRPLHAHFCQDNTFSNNVFIVDKGDGRMTFPRCRNFTFENNIFQAGSNLEIAGLNVLKSGKNNILYSTGNGSITGSDMLEHEKANSRKVEESAKFHLLNPEILDYTNGIVRFAKNSPVNQFGISSIDVLGAGSSLKE